VTTASAPAAPPPWSEIFRTRGRLTLGLILLESVTAVQLLIVITIMPVIVGDLGGLRLYGLAFGASALAAIIALPATGRAADRWGPARALAVVLGIFLVGTLVAATAVSMPIFIAGRFLQGWGLGAHYAVSLGAIARIYPGAHRARVLALLSAAWVVPSLAGPSVGALLASTVGWRWSFFASIPFVGFASWLTLPELAGLPPATTDVRPVPFARLLQLAVGAGALLYALTTYAWWTFPLAGRASWSCCRRCGPFCRKAHWWPGPACRAPWRHPSSWRSRSSGSTGSSRCS
jgi:MFS family permease